MTTRSDYSLNTEYSNNSILTSGTSTFSWAEADKYIIEFMPATAYALCRYELTGTYRTAERAEDRFIVGLTGGFIWEL